jgi:para-aminobenzoate synthetase component 1
MDSIVEDEILFNINGINNSPDINHPGLKEFSFRKSPVSFEKYSAGFEKVLKEIKYGNSYLLNLTCPTPITIDLTLKEIFERSKAKYRLWIKERFVVFSPETFVTIKDGRIASFPMKGTIDASLPDAANQLLSDPKEIAEHYTIVDLIRNDLGSVARQVRVDEFRYIERLETNSGALLQVSSRISGILPDDYPGEIGDIIFRLLPAGSISGAPKEKTIKIIEDSEGYDRGFYTGVFGYFDGNVLDSGVMIRFIESTPNGYIFKSGGGITSFSDPLSEYQEMINKVYVPFT